MHPDGVWIPILAIAIVPIMVIGLPIARAYVRRVERESTAPPPQLSSEITVRLERMEQAIDSIAVEVERISEGQRFTTKLLADRGAPSSSPLTPPVPRQ
ncbi:MAG TPA: hypothetical protein VN651_16455 [Gemmatimonadaceae bacterium]|nr:hypothetical protein [Gemmatimonadaceae bacterium]